MAAPGVSLPLPRDLRTTSPKKLALPNEHEILAAVSGFETQHIQIFDHDNQSHSAELPTSALMPLANIMAELAGGNAVQVVPVHAELTTHPHGELLNQAMERISNVNLPTSGIQCVSKPASFGKLSSLTMC